MNINIIDELNLKKQAQELGVKIWQTPNFLFIVFGFIAVFIMVATYIISKNFDNPQVLIIAESLVATIVLIIGTIVVKFIDQIIKLNKAKSDFISMASHQLRTPLSAIKWELELMLSQFRNKVKTKQQKNLENIFFLNQRMIRLVNDLLDVVRIDQNRLILRKQRIDLTEIVKEVYKDNLSSAKIRNISVNLDIKNNFERLFRRVKFKMPPLRIERRFIP